MVKRKDIESKVNRIRQSKEYNIQNVVYRVKNYTKGQDKGNASKPLEAVQFEFAQNDPSYASFLHFAKRANNAYPWSHMTDPEDLVLGYGGGQNHQSIVQVSPLLIEQMIGLLDAKEMEERANQLSVEQRSGFDKSINDIKIAYENELTGLKNQLSQTNALEKDINTLYKELKDAKDILFHEVNIFTPQNKVKSALEAFVKNSNQSIKRATKNMDCGFLYGIVKQVAKAIIAVFAGIGMILGSPFGQGLAKKEHREKYKKTFFADKKDPYPILSNMKEKIKKLSTEMKDKLKNRPKN